MPEMCELVPLKEASLHTELTMALKTYLSLDTFGRGKERDLEVGDQRTILWPAVHLHPQAK